MAPDVFTRGTPTGDDEVPARVRLVKAAEFTVGEEVVFTAWLELDGRPSGTSSFHIQPAEFAALNEALGGLPPRSKRGLRRWVADRIPFDVVTVRDRLGREWFRVHPDQAVWARLEFAHSYDEGSLVFDAGPVVEVPDVVYTIPDGGQDYERTER